MKTLVKFGTLCAAVALWGSGAQAAVIATLTFDTPSAVVGANEDIPVWLTLTLAQDSDALITDGTGQVISGLTDQDIMDAGFDPAAMTRRIVNNAYQCGGSFGGVCGGGPYDFNFNFRDDGPPSFNGPFNLNLAPGSSTQFLFGTFTPIGGAAPPATYTFYNAIFEFEFFDPTNTDPDVHPQNLLIAATCPSQLDACGFSRTVLETAPGGVPEPATWGLMILGFGGVGATLRRRRCAWATARR